MSLYSRIIKAQDVKLTDLQEKPPNEFVRGLYNPPVGEGEEKGRPREGTKIAHEEIPGEETAGRGAASDEAEKEKAYEGLIEGLERDRRKLSVAWESVAKLIRELELLKEKVMASAEKEILDLTFLIAGKVIHREVSTDREVIISVLRDAMRTVQGKEDVRVRMNPEDYRYITETNPDFLGSYGDILIERDEAVARGGAVVETHSVAVDARLDRQLDKIRDTLYDEYRF